MKETQQIPESQRRVASLIVLWLIVAGVWQSVETLIMIFRLLFR